MHLIYNILLSFDERSKGARPWRASVRRLLTKNKKNDAKRCVRQAIAGREKRRRRRGVKVHVHKKTREFFEHKVRHGEQWWSIFRHTQKHTQRPSGDCWLCGCVGKFITWIVFPELALLWFDFGKRNKNVIKTRPKRINTNTHTHTQTHTHTHSPL